MKYALTLLVAAILLLPSCKKEETPEPKPGPAPPAYRTVEFRIFCNGEYWLDAWTNDMASIGPILMHNDTTFFMQGIAGNTAGFVITPTTSASAGRLYLNGAIFGHRTAGPGQVNPYSTTIPN